MEGYLQKWINFIKGWTPRYFILKKQILYYSKHKGDTEKHTIHLNIARVNPDKNKRTLIIDTGTNKIYLRASSEEDRDKWINFINNEIEYINRSNISDKDEKNSRQDEVLEKFTQANNNLKDVIKEQDSKIRDSVRCDEKDLEKKENIYLEESIDNYSIINYDRRFFEDYNKLIFNKIDEISKLILNFQITYFKFSQDLENINLAFSKKKSKEELKKLCSEFNSVKKDFKGCIDQGYTNVITLKELVKHILDSYTAELKLSSINTNCVSRQDNIKIQEKIQSSNNQVILEKFPLENNNENQLIDQVIVNKNIIEDKYDNKDSMTSSDSEKDILNDLKSKDEINQKTIKNCSKRIVRFERSLSKVLNDFYDDRYTQNRENLPFKIKVSNSMLKDMLKSITKEKIELPIHYNEPLSMLQKLCERFQYGYLLNRALKHENKYFQLAYIAGLILGEVSLNINRILKPFNPILGETFEFYDNNLKYRYFSEQVSHHPPISAYICESEQYVVYGDSRSKNNFKMFKGAMEIIFTNKTHIIFKSSNNHFSYSKPIMFLKGLIMGKPRYDYVGEVLITNHISEDYIRMEFFEEGKKNCPEGYVEGRIFNKNKEVMYYLKGSWRLALYIIEIKNKDEKEFKNIDFNYLSKNAIKLENLFDDNTSTNTNVIVYEIWSIHEEDFMKNLDENDYKISKYSCSLNNITEDFKNIIPPTDSRLRPDQRALENQNLELAEKEKKRIEEKQRNRHHYFEENKIKYEPKYFNEVLDSLTNENIYLYKGDYWHDRRMQNFQNLYQIFLD